MIKRMSVHLLWATVCAGMMAMSYIHAVGQTIVDEEVRYSIEQDKLVEALLECQTELQKYKQ